MSPTCTPVSNLHTINLRTDVSINNLLYCLCNHSTCQGIGGSVVDPRPLKKTHFSWNSATPKLGLICTANSSNPSDSRTPCFKGEAPPRRTMDPGVLDTTSKWSVNWVPTSYVASWSSCRDHSWCFVDSF
jgi:hypothetical protein